MTYPNESVLAGSGLDDAWFFVRGRTPLLIATNGASIINGIQRSVVSIIDQADGAFGSSDEWRAQMGGWNGNDWQSQTGRWDLVTARAVMTVADRQLAHVNPKDVRYGWAEYYAHRWGYSLTRLALLLWTGDHDLDNQMRAANESAGEPSPDVFDVVIASGTILPRWNAKPNGQPSPVTVRNVDASGVAAIAANLAF